MKIVARKIQQRAAIGKDTAFRVRGQPVDPWKFERWQKGCGMVHLNDHPDFSVPSPSPSTPSDISYDTIQDIRSPSSYQWKTTCLGGANAAIEGNTLPSYISLPPIFGHSRASNAFNTDALSENLQEEVFKWQSPTPNYALAASHEFQIVSQLGVLGENHSQAKCCFGSVPSNTEHSEETIQTNGRAEAYPTFE